MSRFSHREVHRLFDFVYLVLPAVAAAFAFVLYLTPRLITARIGWLFALVLAGLLSATAIRVMRAVSGDAVPLDTLVKAYVTLYTLPLIVLTPAVLRWRTRAPSRPLGLALLLLLAFGISLASRYASGYFLDLVNASG